MEKNLAFGYAFIHMNVNRLSLSFMVCLLFRLIHTQVQKLKNVFLIPLVLDEIGCVAPMFTYSYNLHQYILYPFIYLI